MLTLKAFRDTRAHKGQFISLVILVAIAIASYVTFQNGYYNLKASLDHAYSTLRLSDFTVRVDRMPLSAARAVESLPGVAHARVRTVSDVGLELSGDRQATARVISGPGPSAEVNAVHVERGRFPAPDSRDQVLVSTQFATDTKTHVGDVLTLRIGGARTKVRVAGIGTDPQYLYAMQGESNLPAPGTFAVLFVNEATVEHLFGTAHSGNDIAVIVKPGASAKEVSDITEDELKPFGVVTTELRADQPGYTGLQSELEQNRLMARSLPALVLAIATMSLYITLSRMVQAQRGEIGLAKALGYSDGQILRHYLTIAAIVAIFGSVAGVALGLWGAKAVAGSYVSMLGLPFLRTLVYPDVIVLSVVLAVASTFAGAAAPAWKSARIAPAIAMHSDPNRSLSGGHMPLVERLLSPVLPRSFTFRIPLRNIFRAKRRTVYTILGIAVAMILSVTTLAMFDSIDFMIDKAFVYVERWDVMAAFDTPFGDARAAEVRRMDGVKRVQTALALPVTISKGTAEEDVVLTAMRPTADFHGFEPVAGVKPADSLAEGDLVIAATTANKLGVAVGGRVEVDSPLIHDPVAMRVGTISDEMLGSPAYVSIDAAAKVAGAPVTSYNIMYVNSDPENAPRIRDEIYDMPGAAAVQVKADFVEQLNKWIELMDYFGTILLAFGAALAFVVVFTTFTANVTERTREIATMRTIGEDNSRLTVMVTLENLAITLAALPLGLWLGLKVTDLLFATFEVETFNLKAHIAPQSVVRICLLMVAVVLLSEIPPVRRIFHLDLAAATKVME
jgi:putative ABC transport system permease protein